MANIVLKTLFLFLIALSLIAQDDAWLKANGNSPLFYEGLLDLLNGKPSYEVIGFFAFASQREKLTGEPGSTLHAVYFVPAAQQSSEVFVQAKQISSRTNYLLRSKPGVLSNSPNAWNDLSWSTTPIIARYKIDPNNLGVISRLNSIDTEYGSFAPVVFSMSPKPMRIDHYELLVRIQRYSLASLAYEIAGPVDRKCFYSLDDPCLPKAPANPVSIEVGTVVHLAFGLDAGPGEFALHLHGRYKDSDDQMQPTFIFYHQPIFPGSH